MRHFALLMGVIASFCSAPMGWSGSVHAEVPLVAMDSGFPLEKTAVMSRGKEVKVWKPVTGSRTLLFKPSTAFSIPANGVLYLKITYLDEGYGNLNVQLLGENNEIFQPDRFLGLARMDTRQIATAQMRLPGITFKGPHTNILVLRVGLERQIGEALCVESVTLQDQPFDNPQFAYVISDPWAGPYTGPTVKPPDNTTLKGKVMVGYQGWFRTPNDPEGNGWVHWGPIQNGTFTTDMWPDVSQYPASLLEKAGDVKTRSGKPAYLFSSDWPGVVDIHFRWMRENNIDGAFVQRFVKSIGRPDWALANVRASANREGRIWAVEYDVSGGKDATLLTILTNDWKRLVDEFALLKDPNYAREGTKPVVFLWGMSSPTRKISPAIANAVLDFFKNDPKYGGNYVIGGIPDNWRQLDTTWQAHIKKYDCASPWMSRNYAGDVADFKKLNIDYYAHVRPGFSWANLKHLPSGDSLAYTPREGGAFYWNLLSKAAQAKVERLFIGMFDEYDEGTAIMPMSDDPPGTPVRPGVGATFYDGPSAKEHGTFVFLPRAEIALGSMAPAKNIPSTNFFVRMGGQIKFPAAGQYKLSVEGVPGDDVALFVDGKKIVAAQHMKGLASATVPVAAAAGQVMAYRLDYRHNSGTGTLRLLWESETLSRAPVLPASLQDGWGRFITNEGKASDWYLKLTSMGKEMMNGKRPADSPMPQK